MRSLLLIIIGVTAGFLLHAFFFPDVLSNGIIFTPDTILSNEVTGTQSDKTNERFTDITYDGKKFSRTNISIGIADYVTITNESKEVLMSLSSDEPLLATPRGYAYKEQVRARLDTKKRVTVHDTNNPSVRLTITVK